MKEYDLVKFVKIFVLSFFVLAIIFWIWVIFASQKSPADGAKKIFVSQCGEYEKIGVMIGGLSVRTDVANDSCKQALGLSGRKSLESNEGMLFVFGKEGNHGFWMKDMLFPIDIIWVDSDFFITGIERNVSPMSYPQIFGEKFSSKYVLELVSGFSKRNNLEVGNKIIFSEITL